MTQGFLNKIQALMQEKKYREALALSKEKEKETDSPRERCLLREAQGKCEQALGNLAEAEELFRSALSMAEEENDPHDLFLARLLRNLSMTLDQEQKYAEAIPYAEQELTILRNSLPDSDLRIADCMLGLAKHHYEQGRFALASEMIHDCMARYEAKEGRNCLGMSACLNNLGRILENQGENEASIPLFTEAVRIRKELLGTHEETAFTLLNLGTALAGIGSYKEAAQVLLECKDMYMALHLEESPYFEACRANLMLCFNAVCTPC